MGVGQIGDTHEKRSQGESKTDLDLGSNVSSWP